MSKFEKLIQKIRNGKNVTFRDAENLLLTLGFDMKVRGSHHNFRKQGHPKTIAIKKRTLLYDYQIDDLYTNTLKIWNFGFEKASGLNLHKQPNINNIRLFVEIQSRELSLCQKPNFECVCV